jgi:acyl-CoA thioester hydrolase
MKVFTTQTRVRFGETDASGIVYYASYLLYFEIGRIELFRELGLPYDRRVPIRETYCRYRRPAQFDDLLVVHSVVEQVRAKGFQIGGRIYRPADEPDPPLLAEGHTVMVTVGDDGQPVALPPAFRAAFEQIGAAVRASPAR